MSDSPPRTPLLYPRRYFEHADEPLPAALAVFVVHFASTAFIAYVSVWGVFDRIRNPPPGLEQELGRLLFLVAVLAGVFACVGFLLVAAFMHYGAGATPMADGEFGDAVAVAGWAYAPNALSAPVTYLLVRRQLDRLGSSISSPEALQAEAEAVQTPSGLQIALALAVVAWSVYILAYGTAATHDAEPRDTLFLAAIVGVVAFLGSFI